MQIEISFKKIASGLLMAVGAAVILYALYYLGGIIYVGYVLSHQ